MSHTGFALQAFFDQVNPSIFDGFLKAGAELGQLLEGDEKGNLETGMAVLQQRWQVGM